MMQVSDVFFIKCDQCNYVTLVEADDLECDTATYERSMGEEIEYTFNGEICCESCHSWIDFHISAYEYPAGAFNYSDYSCNRGEFVNEPAIEIKYEFDDDYIDYAYQQYLEADAILEYHRTQIDKMSPRDFEYLVGDIFEKMGFSVKITQATRDGGCDIIATKAEPIPFTLIIECKHWGKRHKVGVNVVRSVYGVQTAKQANQSIIVTSSEFTKDARKFAEERENQMVLWDLDHLLSLIVNN